MWESAGMARARKRHVQQVLPLRCLDKNGQLRGGPRIGAGRKPKGGRAGMSHAKRQALSGREPLHVSIRVARDVASLRRRFLYKAVRGAMVVASVRADFRIVDVSIQGTHIHLLVEAENERALANGMRAFEISAARRINAAITRRTGRRRTGAVFPDRYHAHVLRTPRETRNALAYVLNNWRKHREDREHRDDPLAIDSYSTAPSFDGWGEVDPTRLRWPPEYEPLPRAAPQTWLLRAGWKRHGLLSTLEVPGGHELADA